MSRMDIVGFTLAEIALVMLFALLAVSLPQKPTKENDAKTLQDRIKSLEESNAAQKQKIASLEHERDQLKALFESPRADLRSKAVPTCFEIDRTTWLFSVVIHGSDNFEIGGESMSLTEILKGYEPQMKAAKAKGCIHRIQVFYDPGVSTSEYDMGLRRLEVWFSTAQRGQNP